MSDVEPAEGPLSGKVIGVSPSMEYVAEDAASATETDITPYQLR
jgi:hypothetical protein